MTTAYSKNIHPNPLHLVCEQIGIMRVPAYENMYTYSMDLPSVCVYARLLDVLMQESRLYLIFEFLSMDLKKYLDSIPSGQYMDPMLVKVTVFVINKLLAVHLRDLMSVCDNCIIIFCT